jgi:hypothetical protein
MNRTICLSLALAGALAATPLRAASPQDLLAGYATEAARTQTGFVASAERGKAFFLRNWNVADKMPNCAACHTERPAAHGTHVITAKAIRPLAPAANPDRFADAAKAEKWFRRNCTEVVGRECSAAEKADLVRFLVAAGGAS